MITILSDAVEVAELYGYDRVRPEHVVFALLAQTDRHGHQNRPKAELEEICATLESGFRYRRWVEVLRRPQLEISDRVVQALGAVETRGAPEEDRDVRAILFDTLLETVDLGSVEREQAGAFAAPLADLDEVLDALEYEQSAFGFDRIADEVFPATARVDRARDAAQPPDQPPATPGISTERREERRADPSPEKATLAGKERLEAKRAVERSIRDLTKLYMSGQLDPVIGRDAEVDQICRILMRRRKSNVLLVGEPGVGKTALMEGVAARIATSGDPSLSRRPVLQASLGALVAGARYRGDFEIRIELLVEHALERGAVLFFDEMQMLIGSGATTERGMDGANLLKPVLARDGMSLVGATTHDEAEGLRADPALIRRFETVLVNEPDPELMRKILSGAASPYLAHHAVRADPRTLDRLVDFADRYLPHRRFPDKAFDLLDTACVQTRLSGRGTLTVDTIRCAVRHLGGTLPVVTVQAREATGVSTKRMVDRLSEKVGGHPDAVRRLASLVCSGDPSQPVVARLSGPRGVGRRTLARAVSHVLSGPFLEIDAAAGPDRVRSAFQTVLRPGARAVLLLNVTGEVDPSVQNLIRAIRSTGTLPSDRGRPIELGGTVLLIRETPERGAVGFTPNVSQGMSRIKDIESINMPNFSGDRLNLAILFQLKKLSQTWSDSGVSRPIPEVRAVLDGASNAVETWCDVVRLCRDATDVS